MRKIILKDYNCTDETNYRNVSLCFKNEDIITITGSNRTFDWESKTSEDYSDDYWLLTINFIYNHQVMLRFETEADRNRFIINEINI